MSNATTYQEFLTTNGVSLETLGLRELALYRVSALAAVEILRNSSIPILGGDVYFWNNGGIELAFANWHSERRGNEATDEYVNRTCRETSAYIQTFPEMPKMEALFVLVVLEGEPS
jgi:hypothetical protein